MPRPLAFLHVTTFYPPYNFGGDGLFVERLARTLAGAGHHVDVVHSIDAYRLLAGASPGLPASPHPMVNVHGLRSALGPMAVLLSHQTGRPMLMKAPLQTLLGRRAYDVIHFHNISLFGPGVLAMRPAASNPLKVHTTHEHWLVCPTHTLWKFNRRPCEKPECLRCTLLARRPPQLWRSTHLLEESARHVDAFIAPSAFTARMHAERGFPFPMTELPIFVEPRDHDWQHPGERPHARPYFLYVGRLQKAKGVEVLLRAFSRFDTDLLIAGTGEDEADLRRLAAGRPGIRFLGAVPGDQLGAFYAHALASVVPSLTFEVFPTVILEAFARKTPVIAHDLGAVGEIVAQSGGGLLYRSDSELLEALRRVDASPELRASLGARGYDAFTRYWTPAAHLERYFDLLGQLAHRKHGNVPWN